MQRQRVVHSSVWSWPISCYFSSLYQFLQDSPNTDDESSDDIARDHRRSNSHISSTILRENRLSLPNLTVYSNLPASSQQGNREYSYSERQPVRASGSTSRCKSSRKHSRHKSSDGANSSHKSSGKKQSSSKKGAKNSKSSPSLRRNVPPPTKTVNTKLSKSLTSLRSLEQVGLFKAGSEDEYWNRLDALRSSMSISQMTLKSQTESGQLTQLLSSDNIYPDLDKFSPEIYASTSARTKRVQPFQQIGHPDMFGHVSPKWKEFLYERPVKAQRWVSL